LELTPNSKSPKEVKMRKFKVALLFLGFWLISSSIVIFIDKKLGVNLGSSITQFLHTLTYLVWGVSFAKFLEWIDEKY